MLKFLLSTLGVLIFVNLTAQDRTISGTMTSAEDNEPLIGATIMIKGTDTGTITDYLGEYTLSVPSDRDTLVFSYTGFETVEISIGSQTTIDIALAANSELLDEVVVIGYGIQKKKSFNRGNITTVNRKY